MNIYKFCGFNICSRERLCLLDEVDDVDSAIPTIFVEWTFNIQTKKLEEIYDNYEYQIEKKAASSFCDIIPKVKIKTTERLLYYKEKILFEMKKTHRSAAVKVYVSQDFSLELAKEVFISDALPLMCMGIDDCVFLHAACVMFENKTFAFFGDTGAGKSTLTTFLGSQGFEIVSDDMICVRIRDNQVMVSKYLSVMRLWKESYNKLECISAGRTPNGKYLVKCIDNKKYINTLDQLFWLNRGKGKIEFVPLSKMSEHIKLVASLIMGFAYDSDEFKRAYEMVSRITKEKQMYELAYANGFDKLFDLSKKLKER